VEQEIRELIGIASVYRKRGRLGLAADVLTTVLELQKQTYGPTSVEVTVTKCQLAELLAELKAHKESHADRSENQAA
jgi:hypothetical protein